MKPKIALSLSCFNSRKADGYDIMCKAAEYGFEYVELSHSTSVNMVEGIKKAVEEEIIKVSSLHNFCPIPAFASGAVPNMFSPATNSKAESEVWRKYTTNTLEFAYEVGANTVVSHSGSIHYFWGSNESKVNSMFEALGADKISESVKYDYTLYKFLQTAKKKAKKHHEHIIENLILLNDSFREKNTFLCLENRDGLSELPLDSLYAAFINEAMEKCSNVKGWIDTGHAKVKELKGVLKMEEFLQSVQGKIGGWHLHDCTVECKDHKPLGTGDIAFKMVSKYFDVQNHIFVLEFLSGTDGEAIVSSRKFLEDLF